MMTTKSYLPLSKAIVFFVALNLVMISINVNAKTTKYTGMCNASAAAALDNNSFVVADDEDNILRIYDKNETARPLQTISLSKIFPEAIQDGEDLEIDLEAAAVLGDKIFWIGSHSTSRKGKFRPARHRLFALQFTPGPDGQFVVTRVGQVYTALISDLEKEDRYKKYKLHEAKTIKPKNLGGLSIEGLAATPTGELLIGFRNPLSGGKVKKGRLVGGQALLVPLLNPLDVIEGVDAQFGDPIDLDLDGYGIRSIESRHSEEYLIVAGPYHGNSKTKDHKPRQSRVYLWSDKLKRLKKISLNDLNIEAAFFYPQEAGTSVQLLSDDGKLDCNNSFRSRQDKLE